MIGLCGTIDPVEVPEHHGHIREAGFDPGLPIFLWLWSKGMAEQVEGQTDESTQVADPPDEELLEFAEALDVDPEDYDGAEALEKACLRAAVHQANEVKNRAASIRAADPGKEAEANSQEPEAIAIEAYEVALKGEDFDPKLIAELNQLSKTQSERFTGALEKLLKTQAAQMKDVRKELEHVTAIARQATRNDDLAAFERWISRNEDARGYLGEGDTEDLEDDKFSRRRDRVLKKAYKIHADAREDGKTPPSRSKLFTKALKSVRPVQVTRTARVGGSSAGNTTESKPVSQKERNTKAGKTAAAIQDKMYGNRR